MGTTAARKCSWIIQNVLSVLAYELLTSCQAIDIRRFYDNEDLSEILDKVYSFIRKDIPFMETDRELRIDIEKIEKMVRDTDLLNLILDNCKQLY